MIIDTERLKELSSMVQSASHSMDDAAALLMQITTHDNWGCQERHTINQFILENRKSAQLLQAKCLAFTDATRNVAGEFETREHEISGLFESVEGMISKILSIGGGIGSITGIGTGISNAAEIIAKIGGIRSSWTIPSIDISDIIGSGWSDVPWRRPEIDLPVAPIMKGLLDMLESGWDSSPGYINKCTDNICIMNFDNLAI